MNDYKLYNIGKILFSEGRYSDAAVYFEESLKKSPHFKTYEMLYHCYLRLDDIDRAGECIKRSYELNSRNDKTAYEYSEYLLNNKNDAEAAEKILGEIICRNRDYKKADRLLESLRKSKEKL